MDKLDVLAREPQFLDHLAPVWRVLPAAIRGHFIVDESLVTRAALLGVAAQTEVPRNGDRALVASYGDTRYARSLGYTEMAFLEHGAGQSYGGDPEGQGARHPSYAGGEDRDDTTLFMVPGPHPAARWKKYYPKARVVQVGCPKLASLPQHPRGPQPVVAIAFHVPFGVAPETEETFTHYRRMLVPLRQRFHVIGHAHPKAGWPTKMLRVYENSGIPYETTFDGVCQKADLLICDNSSILFEFAATGRPVVVLNAPWFRRDVNHGLRFWEAANVGVQVDEPDQLLAAVALALKDEPLERRNREAALDLVYVRRRGAALAASKAIQEWMKGDSEMPRTVGPVKRAPRKAPARKVARVAAVQASNATRPDTGRRVAETPYDEGEEVLARSYPESEPGVMYVVTSFGRKIRVDANGPMVLCGPPLSNGPQDGLQV